MAHASSLEPDAYPADGHRTSRRLRLASVLVAACLVLTACGGDKPKADNDNGPVTLSVFWWGGQARADITGKVLDLYHDKHPNVKFNRQWQGNSGYYDKLATMATGKNAPDLFQIDDNGLADYTTRGVTLNLKPYVGKQIKTDKFPKALRDAGVVKGRVGGIAAAENTPAVIYDKTVLEQYGISWPTTTMSWDDLVGIGTRVAQASGGKVYGTMDPSADYKGLQVWLRQQGKDLYGSSGKLGFSAADLTRWYQFWQDAAARKATPPADVLHTANGGDVTKQLVSTKTGATSFMWSNQLEELQKNTDHKLGLSPYPGDPKGQWARASMYWAGYAKTKHAKTVVDVINFLVNDPEAGKILGAERGLSPNFDIRKAVSASLTPAMQTSVDFENNLNSRFGPTPVVPPKGHTQIKQLLIQSAETVQYKRATPEQAAASFFNEANGALGG